jgi:lysophospholipase L1-like esterase
MLAGSFILFGPPMLFRRFLFLALFAVLPGWALSRDALHDEARWAGTWAAAPQPLIPGTLEIFEHNTLRLVVHTSVAGSFVRVAFSNAYGEIPFNLSHVHIAIRTSGADIDPKSDRTLLFHGKVAATIAPHSRLVSDAVALPVPALGDLAVSFYLPEKTEATTSHFLALQTSYVAEGDRTSSAQFPTFKTIDTWPFLTGVEVAGRSPSSAIAILGSSTTDGDGSTPDKNRRWPDVLATRLQKAGGATERLGVLNLGIIGNRLLKDSPQQASSQPTGSRASVYWSAHGKGQENPFGLGLGEAALTRFERDVLSRSGVRLLIVCMGINDISFPGTFTSPAEMVSPEDLIEGFRRLIARAHEHRIEVIGTTIPPFENAVYPHDKTLIVYTPAKERVRQQVNSWIRITNEFDAMVDFDAAVRDPHHPTKLLERFDSGDHLHTNDAGYAAVADAASLTIFNTP